MSKCILVVEDQEDNRRILRALGNEVVIRVIWVNMLPLSAPV
jgi:hypothetical protein